MLNINHEIEQLYQVISNAPTGKGMYLFSRMYAWGILSMFNKINEELETLSERLDVSINLDAVSINFDTYCDKSHWTKCALYEEKKKRWGLEETNDTHQTEINRMTNYLPNGEKYYHTTPEVLDSFRRAMHQLCDEDKVGARDLIFAMDKGLDTMLRLLNEIKEKVKNPKKHLYVKLWEEMLSTYKNEEFNKAYQEWVDDIGSPGLKELKARQEQEIFKFLNKHFFRFCNKPTGAEVKNLKLKIEEDNLEIGTIIPTDFDAECAKFEKFIELKEDGIVTINYEKLGKYIYKNYQQFEEEEFYQITDFDRTLDLIHEAMAKQKPSLAKYLKRYEEHQDEELLKDCKKVFEPFKAYLRENFRQTLIDEYIEKLLFDSELKEEAKKALGGQSKKKYCCSIVLALSYYNIFKPEYNNNKNDLGAALNNGLEAENKETLVRYLKDAKNNNNKALISWTSSIIDDLKKNQYIRTKQG